MGVTTEPRTEPGEIGLRLLMAGSVGLAAGVAGLLAKFAGLIPRVRIATLSWGAVVTVVGLALVSHGSLRPPSIRALWAAARAHLPELMAVGLAWSVAFVVEARTDWWWKDGVATLVGAGLIGAAAATTRRVDSRTLVSAALAALLVTYLLSGVFKREQYPFAPFQMYSGTQLDPREVTRYRLIATTGAGDEIDITSVLGTATVAKLVSDPDDAAVAEAMGLAARVHQERRGSDLVSVRLVTETWRVVPYPGEATVELGDSVERMVVDV